MKNIFDISDILYEINNYLSLNEKLKFRLVSRHIYAVCKNIMFLHIGQILSNKLCISNIKSDMIIIRDIPLEIIKDLVIYLECPRVIKPSMSKIPIGIILRISNATIEHCIEKLRTKKMFRPCIIKEKYSLESKILKKYFPNVYPLLD
jgi:hypothetical protein